MHGHRGARAIYPENTIPSFQYAIDAGADAIEMDLAVTQDDAVVVSHDPFINPKICAGPHPEALIRTLTLAELKEYDCGAFKNPRFPRQQPLPGTRIPTLSDVLSLASRGDFQFDIEIKSFPEYPELSPSPDTFARLVLEQIREHKLERRAVVQSFDFRVLRSMHRLAPEIRLSALWEGQARAFAEVAEEAQASIVSPQFGLITAEQVETAHAHNLAVVPWTANSEDAWRRLIEAGVDGIITDDPAGLISYLKEAAV